MILRFYRFVFLFFCIASFPSIAQEIDTTTAPQDWFLRDPEQDHVQGVSVERTYSTLLKDQPSREVLVAVIDSGVDIDHEDLKDVIWTNKNEIPDNGIDDDKNGYIDDIHGWNFIGGENGNVDADTYELTREYVRLKKKFENLEDGKINRKLRAEYQQYKDIKEKFEKERDSNTEEYNMYRKIYVNAIMSIDTLKAVMHTDTLTQAKLQQFSSNDPTLLFAKSFVLNLYQNIGPDLTKLIAELEEGVKHYQTAVEIGYNEDFDSRIIVGDDYANTNEKYYGNNNVKGPDSGHGTHVSGIIAADRKNNLGIKGIADNVKIMSVRAVPDGDERDKDVANAIMYAVDNGAKIINMSFGKAYSPQKEAVDRAVKHAEQKGVLLIHAAGNEGEDIDKENNFPTRFYKDGSEAKNWLEIGASSAGDTEEFVASFSNYGKKSVDLFAPGVQIYSTQPESKYTAEDGTSFASPATAGVAALLMSYFPEFTANEIKDILKKSSRKFDNLQVQRPGGKGSVKFSELSNTGGLVNAYEAVKLAQGLKGQAKRTND